MTEMGLPTLSLDSMMPQMPSLGGGDDGIRSKNVNMALEILGQDPPALSDVVPEEDMLKGENSFLKMLDLLRRTEFLSANMFRTMMGKAKFRPLEALRGRRREDFGDVARDLGLRGRTASVVGFVGSIPLDPLTWFGVGSLNKAAKLTKIGEGIAEQALKAGLDPRKYLATLDTPIAKELKLALESGIDIFKLGDTFAEKVARKQVSAFSIAGVSITPSWINDPALNVMAKGVEAVKATRPYKAAKNIFSTSTGNPVLDKAERLRNDRTRALASEVLPATEEFDRMASKLDMNDQLVIGHLLQTEEYAAREGLGTVNTLLGMKPFKDTGKIKRILARRGFSSEETEKFMKYSSDMVREARSYEIRNGVQYEALNGLDYFPWVISKNGERLLKRLEIIPKDHLNRMAYTPTHKSMLERAFPEGMTDLMANIQGKQGKLVFTKPDGSKVNLGKLNFNLFEASLSNRVRVRVMRAIHSTETARLLRNMEKDFGIHLAQKPVTQSVVNNAALVGDAEAARLKGLSKSPPAGTTLTEEMWLGQAPVQGAAKAAVRAEKTMAREAAQEAEQKLTRSPFGQARDRIPDGWVQVKNPYIHQDVWFDPDAAKFVDRISSQLINSDEFNGIKYVAQEFNKYWKPLTLALPSTTIRNNAQNVWMAYIRNGMNPGEMADYGKDYYTAMTMMRSNKEYNFFGSGVDDLLDATKLGAKKGDEIAFEVASTGEKVTFQQLFRDAREDGLLQGSHMFTEKGVRDLLKVEKKGVIEKGLSPAAFALNKARAVAEWYNRKTSVLDDSFRVATYVNARKKGWSRDLARAEAHKWFGNWFNLTKTERELFAPFVPFYNWLKFNIPTQLELLATRPGAIALTGKLKGAIEKGVPEDDEAWIAEWMKQASPVHWGRDANGQSQYILMENVLAPADLQKLMDPKGMFAELTPILKEPFQQAFNMDFYFKEKIQKYPGEMYEFLGMPMNVRIAHALRNARLVNVASQVAFPDVTQQHGSVLDRIGQYVIFKKPYKVDLLKSIKTNQIKKRRQMEDILSGMRRNILRYEAGDQKTSFKNLEQLERLREELQLELQKLTKDEFELRQEIAGG